MVETVGACHLVPYYSLCRFTFKTINLFNSQMYTYTKRKVCFQVKFVNSKNNNNISKNAIGMSRFVKRSSYDMRLVCLYL